MKRRPPPLAPGARVALIAPAGPLKNEDDLTRALDNARTMGWDPILGDNVLARKGYLAGSDSARIHDLNRAIRDDSVAGIWCVRGGYGSMRILDDVDFEAMKRRPKVVIGYSDITALLLAVGSRSDIIAYHGPTGRGLLTDFSRSSLLRAVINGRDPCGIAPQGRTLYPGRARGVLTGGNLALMTALLGTPYAPRLKGTIVVLEDVCEPVYRIDRMLRQLRMSGALSECSALAFGAFTQRGDGDDNSDASLEELFRETAEWLGRPCVANLPAGHVDDQWTLPLGAMAVLDADACSLNVTEQ